MTPSPSLLREAVPRGFPLVLTVASLLVLLLGMGFLAALAAGLLEATPGRQGVEVAAFTLPMAAAGFLVAGLQERRDPARLALFGAASLLLLASGVLVGITRRPAGTAAVLGGACWGVAPAVLVAAFALPAALRIRMRLTGELPEPGGQPADRRPSRRT